MKIKPVKKKKAVKYPKLAAAAAAVAAVGVIATGCGHEVTTAGSLVYSSHEKSFE